MHITVRQITAKDIDRIRKVFISRWDADYVVSRGRVHKPDELEGFIATVDGKQAGLITYKATDRETEITSIDSFIEHHGIGTALIDHVVQRAKEQQARRIFVITTNDNLQALRFYQKRGFHLQRVYPNAVEAGRKLKPTIPLIGKDEIPVRDEIELDIVL